MAILFFIALAIVSTGLYSYFTQLPADKLWLVLPLFLAFYIGWLLVYAVAMYLYTLTIKFEPIEKSSRFCRINKVVIASHIRFYAGIRAKYIGLEKIPTDSRFLIVSNHKSNFDPIILLSDLGKYDISFVSKPSNMKIFVAGKVAYNCGTLPINREDNREALKTIIQASEYLKKDICNMAIYPEGTRSKTGEMLPFHAGSFKIAQRAGVPLVIAVTKGTENVKKNFPFRLTRVTFEVLEVLPADKVKAMSTQELSDYSRQLIAKALEE